MSNKFLCRTFLIACGIVSAAYAVNRDFIPDFTFKDSSLTGWHTVGQVSWRAENGEIIGTPKDSSGGWLVLDKGYQDIQVYADVRCTGACKTGILLRAAKTPEGGLKGTYVSLGDGGAEYYDLTLSAEGKELNRAPLGNIAGPIIRMAAAPPVSGRDKVPGFSSLAPAYSEQQAEAAKPPTPPPTAPSRGAGRNRSGRPAQALLPNEWNSVQLIVDADLVWLTLNGRAGGPSAVTDDQMMGFGPVALYAGGSGEVHFKDVGYKDLNHKIEPKETVSQHFRMQRISDFYYGWSAAAADINHDGVLDVVSGPYYYLGPDYTERREFTSARTYNPSDHFTDAMVNFSYDFTGDGWPDILVINRPIYLYVNPRGESRRWDRYNVVPQATAEIELLKDIDGDGKPEILLTNPGAVMAYAKPDWSNPTAPWAVHNISEPGLAGPHGMGIGDINRDGRMDVVNSRGWWEQPATGADKGPWKFHEAAFGNGGAEMGIYDVNGDGLTDVVTAIAAHRWGFAWFEQKRDSVGVISFVRHDIMGDFSTKNAGDVTFSEPHAATFADLDGDGVPDMITGKRLYSHLESHLDPDTFGPAVLYWYRTVRNPKAEGGAEFVPELIHNRSGVGSYLAAADLDGNGTPDVITSTNKGTFIFWNNLKPAKRVVAKR
ncbi:MAG: FG-GAP-like repeat-containing protein [Bryobacteraceae bacterium]